MTSRISFSKMVKYEWKRLGWLTAVQCLVFGLLIPFRVLMVLMVRADQISQNNAMQKTMLEVFCKNVGYGHVENTFVILCAGVFCALCVFSYLHSAEQLDFYHSLAVRREYLFAVKYLSGVLTFAAAYLGSQLLGVLIGAAYGAVSAKAVLEVATASVQGVLFFLCSYSGALFAAMLSGKILTSLFATGVLVAYVPMLYILWYGMNEIFLSTSIGRGVLPEGLQYSSPWAFCVLQTASQNNVGNGILTGIAPSAAQLCQLLAIAAVFSLISLLLYRIRRSEAAGSALAYHRTEAAVKLLLSVPSAMLSAVIAHVVLNNLLWEFFVLLLFGILACVIMEFIYRWDIRLSVGRPHHILVTIVLAAGLYCGLRYYMVSCNTWLPAEDEIESMAILDRYWSSSTSYRIDGKWYSVYSEKDMPEILDYFETDEVSLVYRIAENGVQNTVDGAYTDTATVGVKYRLKNGKEIYRCYEVSYDLYLEVIEDLTLDPEYYEKYSCILMLGENDMADMEINVDLWIGDEDLEAPLYGEGAAETEPASDIVEEDETVQTETAALEETENDYFYETTVYDDDPGYYMNSYSSWLEIPSDKRWDLIEAYQKDIRDRTYRELTEASGDEAGVISLYTVHKGRDITSATGIGNYSFDESYINTLQVIREIIDELKEMEAAEEE